MNRKTITMFLRRFGVLAVSAVILISMSACSGSKDVVDQKVEKAEEVENDTLGPDSVVVSVGDETATYRELQVYMYILKAKYQDVFGSKIWSYKLDDEHTMSMVATEQVINMITEMKVISRQAGELGVELSNDEKADIKRFAQTIYDKATESDIADYYLDVDTIAGVYCENEIANKVYDACINGIADSISDTDARQITVQYIFVKGNGKKALKKAKEYRKYSKQARDFQAYAQSRTDADDTQITCGSGDMCEEFMSAALQLKTGETSKVVEASEGYYVIYCVNDNEVDLTNQKKEQLIADAQKERFEKQYNEWAAGYQIEVSDLILK